MPTQLYSVTEPPIQNLLTWITSSEIAVPEIQRPFVWDGVKVRNLLDSLFQGFPVGYLIIWRNPDVRLKDGTSSSGKRILIDGQQRVIALMSALLGREVINKDYKKIRIQIAFHPIEQKFEVLNPVIEKDATWIHDISKIFNPQTSISDLLKDYCLKNPSVTWDEVFRSIELLRGITSNQIGLIELNSSLDIDIVTKIFIRVNSEGVPLSQADFAMSKIAVNEAYGGNHLRKAIDYFCHLAVAPEFYTDIIKDREFTKSKFFPKMEWLRNESDDIYDPSYTDMLRVAFTSEFQRGRLKDLVALLSGRNFETKQYEEAIVENSFRLLDQGIIRFMNEWDFKHFIIIIRSAGFVNASMIRSKNALNFAYILYLTLRDLGIAYSDIQHYVSRWFVFSILTGRYSGSPETIIDKDIRAIHEQGIDSYTEGLILGELSDAFWENVLPRAMDTSVASSPYFHLFQASQVKMNDKGFLSKDIFVRELIDVKSDVHHLFPRDYLKKNGLGREQYNQIANYVVIQSEIDIAISNKEPRIYFGQLMEQVHNGPKRYGNIVDLRDLEENFRMNCIPEDMEKMTVDDYSAFLEKRRRLIAKKIKQYFESL